MTEAERKCYILCDSTYMTLWKRQNYWDRNHSKTAKVRVGGEDRLQRGTKGLWGVMKIFYIFTAVIIIQLYIFVKNQTL